MNSNHRKTLNIIFTDPINGKRADFHRPHPNKEALRYRVKAAREFLETAGVKP